MSYGTDLPEPYRQAGVYAGMIFNARNPAICP